MLRRTLAAVSAVGLAAVIPALGTSADAAAPEAAGAAPSGHAPEGSFALAGDRAAEYRLPADVVRISRATFADGATSTRYQQMVGGAAVLNGQITVIRDAGGEVRTVIGAHYPDLRPTSTSRTSQGQAVRVATRLHGSPGSETADLRIDPRNGRLFYSVDQIRRAKRWVTWIDAQTGNVKNTFNALTEGEGIGVKNDTKQFETVQVGGVYELRNADGNGPATIGDAARVTEDAGNRQVESGPVMTDADDIWDLTRTTYTSPDQRPGVDAHYYAGVVDDYYVDTFGRNSIDDAGLEIVSVVHFARNYCNAFWNGEQMTYGDGDGRDCLPLSGGLDVVGHELTHGVTEFTSNLIYENESGALNESFSDMMGNSMEFFAAQSGSDPAATPDWRIGEDVITDTAGFRNMGDPQEFADPDHYSERLTGTADNGGVHSNSGIPNHAYYLLVNGGRNVGCDGSVSGHTHTANCDTTVAAIGLDTAEQVFYQGFTSLPEYANMCDARNATIAAGHGEGPMVARRVGNAWTAVGVVAGCTPGVPPPPPCVGDATASIPFESPHPYGNNGDCTWTYDNGSAGFAFHFSLLDTEKDFDFVHVLDAAGNVLATYTGTSRRAVTSPCIPTDTGSVRLVTDSSVTAPGFIVDAVEPC